MASVSVSVVPKETVVVGASPVDVIEILSEEEEMPPVIVSTATTATTTPAGEEVEADEEATTEPEVEAAAAGPEVGSAADETAAAEVGLDGGLQSVDAGAAGAAEHPQNDIVVDGGVIADDTFNEYLEDYQESKESASSAPSSSAATMAKLEGDVNSIAAAAVGQGGGVPEIKSILKSIGREELELIILKKVIESVNSHTVVGNLRAKCLHLHGLKDKLFQKSTVLAKQVSEMSKALTQYADNATKSPAQQKPPAPLKFYRSVGLQVNSDTYSSRPGPWSRTNGNSNLRMTDSSANALMKQMSAPASATAAATNPAANGHVTSATSQGMKRTLKPTISVADVKSQVGRVGGSGLGGLGDNSPLKMARVSPGSPYRFNNQGQGQQQQLQQNHHQQQQQQMLAPRTAPTSQAVMAAVNSAKAAAAAQAKVTTTAGAGGLNGLIDLTSENNKGGVILNQDGVNYRVVNHTGMGQGMQLVKQANGGYQLVSPQQVQSRPILIQQANLQGQGGQGLVGGKPRLSSPLGVGGQPLRTAITIRPQNHQRPLLPAPTTIIRTTSAGNTLTYVNVNSAANRFSTGGAGTATAVTTAMTNGQGQGQGQHNNVNAVSRLSTNGQFNLPMLPGPSSPMGQGHLRKGTKDPPPKPELTLQEQDGGIVLSWTHKTSPLHAEISTYQIYACQQPLSPSNGHQVPPSWKRVGDVNALPLPMACTLSQFSDENRYHFIVRGLDVYNRSGPFCEIVSIVLRKKLQQY